MIELKQFDMGFLASTNTGMRWNVSYEHLFTVIDADQNTIDVSMISE